MHLCMSFVETREWLVFLVKLGAFCNFAFGCIFVLSALCSPSSKSPQITIAVQINNLNKTVNKFFLY